MNERRTAASATGKVSSRVAGRTSSGFVTTIPAGAAGPAMVRPARLALGGLDGRMPKVRDLPEQVKAFVDLPPRHVLQALSAEAFDRKRPHHAAVKHGLAKDCGSQLWLRSQIAVETAGKGIARAGGSDNLSQMGR